MSLFYLTSLLHLNCKSVRKKIPAMSWYLAFLILALAKTALRNRTADTNSG